MQDTEGGRYEREKKESLQRFELLVWVSLKHSPTLILEFPYNKFSFFLPVGFCSSAAAEEFQEIHLT